MNKKVLDHYLQYSQFTYPGLYENYLKSLTNNIRELGLLVRKQLIHRTTLAAGNTGSNEDLKYGDMTKVPWSRQAEDDYFNTAVSIIAELFRRDSRGFTLKRKPQNKVVLTCRHTTLLMASILKAKGIPGRVRSGNASYFPEEKGLSSDHWINEYWSDKESRWIIIDVDGSLHNTGFDMYDLPPDAFDYPAKAWLAIREGKVDADHFWNAKPAAGLKVVGWALFYDFHCLMNNEIVYLHSPAYLYSKWDSLTEDDRLELDKLAKIMLDPEKNFDRLAQIWEVNRKYRILKGGLL
ncbi:transglutaminase domain-containing protein [Candidatus Roizmanbacteria bacterium]|nr:transglutaminase domain-containing protein [Candidatus Roizmanbacteria bacterium]